MKTLILADGSGTRLFPLSRTSYPKQFIPLFENESLFQKTVQRPLLFSEPEEVYEHSHNPCTSPLLNLFNSSLFQQ